MFCSIIRLSFQTRTYILVDFTVLTYFIPLMPGGNKLLLPPGIQGL